MAVRNIEEAKKLKKEKKQFKIAKTHVIIAAAMILLFGTALATTLINYAEAASYNEKASEVYEEASAVSEESSEIAEILNAENHDEYFEKIAREQYGYCKNGEKVYYDSAYGE